MNRVVARFADGRLLKGITADFSPIKNLFHLSPIDAAPGTKPVEVNTEHLKALIFVKDFEGDPSHDESNVFDPNRPAAGRRILVEFADGETLVGTTAGYQPGRPGFFLVPADHASNIERCYVVTAATRDVRFL